MSLFIFSGAKEQRARVHRFSYIIYTFLIEHDVCVCVYASFSLCVYVCVCVRKVGRNARREETP